jgi:tRNA nucleotidyltransferase (CCA-adding enzyme)
VAPTALLRQAVPRAVRSLCERFASAGFHAWVVGGCVRDLLLAELRRLPPGGHRGDWDIATDARPEQVEKLFGRVISTGIEHGTVTVLVGRQGYEVTTLRSEGAYSDSRHPDQVTFVAGIEEDLARRDFTINAIAYDPLNDQLLDPFGGQEDLARERLRAVGDPRQRFAEDGLRVLRAARFVATLEVTLDPDTAQAIQPSLDSYRRVSPERIRDEWLKALKARAPSRAFETMQEHGLLQITAPELSALVGCEQNRHHAFDVWRHTLTCVDACPPDPRLRLGALLHDVGKPPTRAVSEKTEDYTFHDHERIGAELADRILLRLRFSNADRNCILRLVQNHVIVYDGSWTDAAVRRWLRRVGPDAVESIVALSRADILAKGRDVSQELSALDALQRHVERVLAAKVALSVRDLAIDGHDLIQELGLSPGPQIGELLRGLLELVLENPALNQRDTLLADARARLESGRSR